MSIDIQQQAVAALQNEDQVCNTMAEAYVIGYKRGWDQALALTVGIGPLIHTSADSFSARMRPGASTGSRTRSWPTWCAVPATASASWMIPTSRRIGVRRGRPGTVRRRACVMRGVAHG